MLENKIKENNLPSHFESPSIEVLGTQDIVQITLDSENSEEEIVEQPLYSSLASHVMSQFRINKDAKRNSGVEDDITRSLEAYNGTYSKSDKARIAAEGGSKIFMQLTATKCRNAASWLKDILLSAKQKSWSIGPTLMADIPTDLKNAISVGINKEFEDLLNKKKNSQQSQPQAPSKNSTTVKEAQETVRELNQEKREILDSVYKEIQKEAKFNMLFMERQIDDQFTEGGYYEALSTFINDFTVFPTAFLKGPIVINQKRLSWENGLPVVEKDYKFIDKCISPYDIYPAPEAGSLQEGALCEHLRLSKSEVYDLIDSPGYKESSIYKVLDQTTEGVSAPYWLDTGVEADKSEQEKRGTQFEANNNVIHGIHFFGAVSAKILKEWGMIEPQLDSCHPEKQFEVEVILLNETVVKCILNGDPLLRRPYYSASYQSRPGSIWGRSLPMLMEDIQRMINATARALSNNMALASGPQVEVYIDRLADDGDIENIKPFKIWQLTTDPSGGSGRAINFFQPKSNASELLSVFTEFEQRADDATGIPRYAYGNEKTGGAATTASGLAMLFESSSKMIKDAVKNIDSGVTIPRVKYQFYWNILINELDFTGDIQVKAIGSSTLTIKGAEQIMRNEFLKVTANAVDQQIMGVNGRAALLRQMGEDLGLTEDIVPDRLDQKKAEKEAIENSAKQQEVKMQELEHIAKLKNLGAETQINGQIQMAKDNDRIEIFKEQNKNKRHEETIAAKYAEIKAFNDQNSYRLMQKSAESTQEDDTKKELQARELAVKLQTGSGI